MLFPILTNVNITELICTIGPGEIVALYTRYTNPDEENV